MVVAVARPAAADTTYRVFCGALHLRILPLVRADDVHVDRRGRNFAVGRGVNYALQVVAGSRRATKF